MRTPLLLTLVSLSACVHVSPLCPAIVGQPGADTFGSLLLYSYDPHTRELPQPTLDCTGTPVFAQAQESERCQDEGDAPPPHALPAQPFSTSELAVDDVPGGKLVWLKVRALADGEAVGPVAWVEPSGGGWSVRALGTLQALSLRPHLKLETVQGTTLLVAEGERCDPAQPTRCSRLARVLPLRASHFVPEPLHLADGKCVGAALFHLVRLESQKQGTGWLREYEMSSTLDFSPTGLAVHEQLVVSDKDRQDKDSPSRVVRRAQADRVIHVEPHRLVTDDASLWNAR